jgi:hypothetical protein
MLRRAAGAVLLAAAMLAVPAYGQDVKLEWKLKEGDKFFLENTSVLNQTLKTGGMDVKQDLDQTMVSSFTVKKKNADGSLVLEQKIETVRLKGAGAGVDPKSAQTLEGAVFTFTVTPRWEITRFDGYDNLVKKLGGENKAMEAEIRKYLTEDVLKATSQETFGFLPDKAVAKGGKWERKFVYPLGPFGTLTSTNKYTYEGKEKVDGKEVDKITSEMSMTYAVPKQEAGAPLQVTKGDLKVEGAKGTIFFDSAAGRLVRSEAKIPVKGTMTFSASGRDTEIEITQQESIKNRVLDKNPSGT